MKIFNEMREQKGFTLIELAIVLVIIGIIIGAVLKGQDLIESARIKKFDNTLREWETSVWTYVDRKGLFPGDTDTNGIIGDSTTAPSVGMDIRAANFINEPDPNPLTVGSLTWYVYFGNDGGSPARNLMAACVNTACTTSFDNTYIKYIESFDTVIDGSASGTAGNVVCVDASDITTKAPIPDDDPAGIEMIVHGSTIVPSTDFVACDTDAEAMLYYFDRGRE